MKLLLGDCIERMKELPENSVDTIITDPPYGTTACKWDSVIPFDLMWGQLNRLIKSNGAIILFGSEPFSSYLRISNIKNYKYDWVWEKTQATGFFNVKKRPLVAHENICVFYKEQCLFIPHKTKGHSPINNYTKRAEIQNKTTVYGKCTKDISGGGETERYPRSVQIFSSDKQKNKLNGTIHPTQKPVALMEYLIKTYTNEKDAVLDFTMGSGTTGIACVNTNREFIGIEKEPEYMEIAKKRLECAVQKRKERLF